MATALNRASLTFSVNLFPGYSPLHCSTLWGQLETVKTLVALGANMQLRNFRGERATDVASRYLKTDCAEYLNWAGEFLRRGKRERERDVFIFERNTLRILYIFLYELKMQSFTSSAAEAKQDLVSYITHVRDTVSDPDKVQGKLSKEDKVR